jgi:hypothetical protein
LEVFNCHSKFLLTVICSLVDPRVAIPASLWPRRPGLPWFQGLSTLTKINKGQTGAWRLHVIHEGTNKVNDSQVALLQKLSIKPSPTVWSSLARCVGALHNANFVVFHLLPYTKYKYFKSMYQVSVNFIPVPWIAGLRCWHGVRRGGAASMRRTSDQVLLCAFRLRRIVLTVLLLFDDPSFIFSMQCSYDPNNVCGP